MLSYMRKNAKSWIVTIPIGIVILVFIFFYGFTGLKKDDQEKAVATIGSRKITLADYQTAYRNTLEFYRSMYKNQLNEEMIEQMGLRQRVLENLIDREVLLQEAARLGISIPPEEVRKAIVNTPSFQENGMFSRRQYERLLNYYGISAGDYERDKQKDLSLEKIRAMIKNAVRVSDKELRDYYNIQNEQAKIEYIAFNPQASSEDLPVSEQEVAAFYDVNKEKFRIPETAKAKYIIFDPKDFEGKVEIVQDEIKEYYESDLDRVTEPKTVKARHILFKLDQNTPAEKVQAVQAKAASVLERLKNGEDFAKLAKEYSEDKTSAEKGGELGYFKKGEMVKPFEEAAWSLKPGELSSVIRTPYGFHLIRVDDIKEERTKSLDEVRDSIEKELRAEKARTTCQAEAKRAYNRLFKSREIDEYAAKNGLKVKATDYFTYGMAPEGMDAKELFSKEAFALAPGEIAPAFAIEQRFVLLKLEDKKEAAIPALEQIREKVVGEVKKDKQAQKVKENASQALKAVLEGKDSWQNLPAKYNLKTEQADIKRAGDFIPSIGRSKAIREAVFEGVKPEQVLNNVFDTDKGSVLVKVKELQLPDDAAFAKERDQIAEMLAQKKETELFDQFLQGLKATAELQVNTKLLPSA
jgi:peptidyl-prolyl cis-trans isomerase D